MYNSTVVKIFYIKRDVAVSFFMESSFHVHLHVRIPTLCRVVEHDANSSETLNDVKARILSSFNVLESSGWNFFMQGKDFIQLDGELECSKIAFIHTEMLYLHHFYSKQITVFYNGIRASVAIEIGAPLSSICQTVCTLFQIKDDEQLFFMNPLTYGIEAFDVPPQCNLLILKTFNLGDRELIFQTNTFPEQITNTSIQLVSKILLIAQFKTFITTLKIQKCDFKFMQLSEERVQELYTQLINKSMEHIMDPLEIITFLFTVLASFEEPLIPKELANLAKDIGKIKDQKNAFKQMYIIFSMLPMSSHCILLELSQAITQSYYDSRIKEELVDVMHEILFNESASKGSTDLVFTKMFLNFGPYLMNFPGTKNLRSIGDTIAVVVNDEVYSINGKEDPSLAEPFEFKISIADFLQFNEVVKEKVSMFQAIAEINNKITMLKDTISKSRVLISKRKNQKGRERKLSYLVAEE